MSAQGMSLSELQAETPAEAEARMFAYTLDDAEARLHVLQSALQEIDDLDVIREGLVVMVGDVVESVCDARERAKALGIRPPMRRRCAVDLGLHRPTPKEQA